MPTIQKTRKIYEFLRWYISLYQKTPTLRRIANQFGMKSTAGVHRHLATLRAWGWINRKPYERKIEIVKQEQAKAA